MRRADPFVSNWWRSIVVLLAAAALVVGCGGAGGDGASSPPPPVFDARTVTQPLGTAGGSIALTAADGTA